MGFRRLVLALMVISPLQLFEGAWAGDSNDIEALEAAMTELSQAFVDEDVAAIKAHMTPDHVAIGPTYDGPVSIDEQIAVFPRITLTKWIPTQTNIVMLADTVAMSSFALSITGTIDGRPLHERAFATEIWVKHNGKWLQRLYQETAIGE